MQNVRSRFSNKLRDGWVEIDLGSLEHNIKQIKSKIPKDTKIMAVIKADGYGHGAIMCAPTLLAMGISSFGVASLDEGLELRSAKIDVPILVLGATPIWAFECAIKNDITLSIFNDEHLEVAYELYKRFGKKLRAHIKIDSGMNRIGVQEKYAKEFINRAMSANYIDIKGIFTHFADVEDEKLFNMQLNSFKNIVHDINTKDLVIHCSNSPASIIKDCYFNMVRIGIVMWGLTPFSDSKNDILDLKPVMKIKGRITNIHKMQKGEGVSYGHTFVADKETVVATIPIGYADGVARKLSNKIYAMLNGVRVHQIGNITMDQMMFDITNVNAKIGDIITLVGDDSMSIDEWAKILDTINYELTCRMKVRLPRIYTRE